MWASDYSEYLNKNEFKPKYYNTIIVNRIAVYFMRKNLILKGYILNSQMLKDISKKSKSFLSGDSCV